VTISVEWEQARRQDRERSSAMLTRLADEIRSQAGDTVQMPVELIFCVDEAELERCRSFVLPTLGDEVELFEIRFAAASNIDYYALKNLGVAAATGELVVFVDSDVLPEPRWLANLLAPFEDPDVSVVGGNSYVELTGTYSRAFALTWFLPLRYTVDTVTRMSHLATNNLAFRREVAERFPFPSMPETSRGSCQVLRRSMARHGLKMMTAEGARVGHPAPTGLGVFFLRAFSRGRDRLLFASPGRDRTWRGTRARLTADIRGSVRRLYVKRADVGLSLAAFPLAVAITTSFMLCCALGELLTMANRGFMVSHFRV
jgi:Glycosyl transferase family 2